MQLALDAVLICLLAATLFHALRLERALGVLKQDRAQLEGMIANFDAAAQAADQSVQRLRASAENAGQQLSRQIDRANTLRDDLVFLAERADRSADRLEQRVRNAKSRPEPASSPPRLSIDSRPPEPIPAEPPEGRLRSQAERDLLKALRLSRISVDPNAEVEA